MPTTSPFEGYRGTLDFLAFDTATSTKNYELQADNYNEAIYYSQINGMAPLTAMTTALRREATDNPKFTWFEQYTPNQSATVTGLYTDQLSTHIDASTTFSAGDYIYVKMAEAAIEEFREGHSVLIRNPSLTSSDRAGIVVAKVKNGASSYLRVKLTQAVTAALYYASSALLGTQIDVVGNANPEGGVIPDSISYDPNELYNYTQIFRTPLEISRTAMKTRFKTGDALAKLRRDVFQLHTMEMEKAFLFGYRYIDNGDNQKPRRLTMGLLNAIAANASANVLNYTDDTIGGVATAQAGKTWVTGGEYWMDTSLEQIFRYGSTTKLAYCGSGALLGLQTLSKAGATINIQSGATQYGIKVAQWITPFGTLMLKTHPMFSANVADRHRMVIFEPDTLRTRFITETMNKYDQNLENGGHQAMDGIKEEFLTEAGLEYYGLAGCGILNNVGIDNPA